MMKISLNQLNFKAKLSSSEEFVKLLKQVYGFDDDESLKIAKKFEQGKTGIKTNKGYMKIKYEEH